MYEHYRGPKAAILFYSGEMLLVAVMIFIAGFLFGRWVSPAAGAVEATPTVVVEPVELPQEVAQVEALPVVEAVEEPTPEPVALFTAEELEMLALVIYQEAGGDACSDSTRLMVGNVVMNRVADPRFPDTIEEVLLAKGQYGRLHWTGLVWPARAELPQEAHAVARAYECAERILSGERYLPEDVIFQSEYIQGEIVAEQDGFYFCR